MYIYKHPNFFIPKEFQDWLIAAYNWKHNWNKVIDISWNWNHGTANGGVVMGRRNNTHYMKFDGNDDYVQIGNIPTYEQFSIYIIAKTNFNNQHRSLFCHQLSSNLWADVINFYFYDDNTLNFWYRDPDWTTWHKIAYTPIYYKLAHYVAVKWYNWYDYIYENWQEKISSITNNILNNTDINKIWMEWDDARFNWIIWLVLFYNKALSPQQIQKMYDFFRQWYYD